MKWTAPELWPDGECWIIGGGPSMARQFGVPEDVVQKVMTGEYRPSALSPHLTPIHDKHVIAVNNAYMIGTWIDVEFFGDSAWYLVHRKKLAEWPGLKVSCAPREGSLTKDGIKYLAKDRHRRFGISRDKTKVSWNANSGAAAISMAAHFGAKRIILLGFDMKLDKANVSHWHGAHSPGKKAKNPFPRHLKGFKAISEDAKAMGIEIINASPDSAIVEFPRVSLEVLI